MPFLMGGGNVPLIGRRAGALTAGGGGGSLLTLLDGGFPTLEISGNSLAREQGIEFVPAVGMDVRSLWVVRPTLSAGAVGRLSVMAAADLSTRLVDVEFSGASDATWLEVDLASPLSLAAATSYVLTCRFTTGTATWYHNQWAECEAAYEASGDVDLVAARYEPSPGAGLTGSATTTTFGFLDLGYLPA